MKNLFVATIRIAIDADAAHIKDHVDAEEWLSGLFSARGIFDWCYGHKDNVYPDPELVQVNEKTYDEGDLFGSGDGESPGILGEIKRVRKCKYKDLPLLMGTLKHDEARSCLEQRLKE